MVISLRRWTGRLLFMIAFILLLMAFTGCYQWLIDAISPIAPFGKPKGEAVKAFQMSESMPDSLTISERLRWFYWFGE